MGFEWAPQVWEEFLCWTSRSGKTDSSKFEGQYLFTFSSHAVMNQGDKLAKVYSYIESLLIYIYKVSSCIFYSGVVGLFLWFLLGELILVIEGIWFSYVGYISSFWVNSSHVENETHCLLPWLRKLGETEHTWEAL